MYSLASKATHGERTNPARPSTPHDTEDADRLIRRIEARLSRACEEQKDNASLFVRTRPWAPTRKISPRVQTKFCEVQPTHPSPSRDERMEAGQRTQVAISSKDILVYPHSTVCYSARLTRLAKSPVQLVEQPNPTLRVKSIEPVFSQPLQSQTLNSAFTATITVQKDHKRSQSAIIQPQSARNGTQSPPICPSTTPNQLSRCQSVTDESQGPTPNGSPLQVKTDAVPKLSFEQIIPTDTTTWIGDSLSGRSLKSRRGHRKTSPWELPGNAITLVEEAPPTAPYVQPPAFQGRKLAKPPHQNLTILQKHKTSPRIVSNIVDMKSAPQHIAKRSTEGLPSQHDEPQSIVNLESMEIVKIKLIDGNNQKQNQQSRMLPSLAKSLSQ